MEMEINKGREGECESGIVNRLNMLCIMFIRVYGDLDIHLMILSGVFFYVV